MNRDELLKSLSSLDFMAVDLGLYLNTHPDVAQVRLDGDVAGIDLAQIRPVSGELQVHRIGGHRRHHQAVFIQHGLPFPDDGDIVIGICRPGAYRRNDIEPQAKGHGQGQQDHTDFILHGLCLPFPPGISP